jgi:hypothetical protein
MLEFARQRIKEYTPHDKFAMDIASTDDGTLIGARKRTKTIDNFLVTV